MKLSRIASYLLYSYAPVFAYPQDAFRLEMCFYFVLLPYALL